MDQALQARMRQIPAIQELYRQLQWERPTVWQKEGLNQVLVEVREEVRNGQAVPVLDRLLERIRDAAQNLATPSLRPVINATGVVIHTNLGRSPLSQEVMDRVRQVASGYSTLEYRLDQGVRGSRHDHVGALLQQLIGAEAAMVVNNNAAAVLLALSQLAKGYEVIVSRGQLVEIGGSFRIPEVMAASGAHLIEVGATNKTHLEDYRRAVSAETRA
ncbi:MAG: L-seryl-tRNA(Sec) selenium transferase, partial [Firmicutes bacterium]|nr:L-seryl-tRNA(Sec) selenium transferase [Bacillota bacterium]